MVRDYGQGRFTSASSCVGYLIYVCTSYMGVVIIRSVDPPIPNMIRHVLPDIAPIGFSLGGSKETHKTPDGCPFPALNCTRPGIVDESLLNELSERPRRQRGLSTGIDSPSVYIDIY
jgi:hypothetical protein